MSKQFERHGEETWRDVVERIAKLHGMDGECLQWFDDSLTGNIEHYGSAAIPGRDKEYAEKRTAWEALYEWDCLPVEEIV